MLPEPAAHAMRAGTVCRHGWGSPLRILLWKIGALGDIVMTTPLVRQLRRALPAADIDYLVGMNCAVVLQGNPHLSRVIPFDESILYRRQPARLRELTSALQGYDTVFVLDKHWAFGWLARLAGVPRRVGFRRRAVEGWAHTHAAAYGGLRHEIDCYLDLAAAAGLHVDREDRALELPAAERVAVPGAYVVAINSGGSNAGEASDVRKMPAALFAGLVAALAERTQVVFVGAPAEQASYAELARRHAALNLCGQTSLRQAWHVLAHADEVYTTDTGLMHMASACGAQTVAIFGPTHPARKCPPGARWVWRDEATYDSAYELFGRLPKGRYFADLEVADILSAQRRAPVASCGDR
jgi:ADP-heptose:LPS heptosyltransferase